MLNQELLHDNVTQRGELNAKATRDAFGEAMVILGKENPDVVALNADLESSVKLTAFRERFPHRSFQMGVAEANMASVATGLALYGKIPFLASFAAFSPAMNFSNIRLAALSEANIKIASSHYGLNIGEDGVSAQMLSDVAMMRAIPNMTIITPVDYNQAGQAVFHAARHNGPVYLRFTRARFPIIMKQDAFFEIGNAQLLRSGTDVTLVATGSMVASILFAAQALAESGINAEVINVHTIKPLDSETILNSARKTNAVVTIEEHQIFGGLGSAVAEVLSQHYPTKMDIIGVDNEWGESGTQDELLRSKRLDEESLVERIRDFLKMEN